MGINELLSTSGLKCTRQRTDVLNVLLESDKPLTADDIFERTKNMALSTIYRIIEKLLEKNIVVKTTLPQCDKIFYELTANEHKHYAICLSCHKMQYIEHCPIHNTHINDFTVTGHKLELYGYCTACSKK